MSEEGPIDELFPQKQFRMLVNGVSGSGLTNMIFSAIMTDKLKFSKLYLFIRDAFECEDLVRYFLQLSAIKGKNLDDLIYISEDASKFKVDELDGSIDNLVIFDCMVRPKEVENIKEHFEHGIKKNCSYIYINYFQTPEFISSKCDYFALFKPITKQQREGVCSLMSNLVNPDEFWKLWKSATKEKYSWLLVDKKTTNPRLRFRKGWDCFVKESE